jgi:thiamine kinase-like enzyme
LIKIIQGYPDFCELLDALRASWRIQALIHNDIKWDNCLVYGKEGAARITRLKLIDWEQSDAGDDPRLAMLVLHDDAKHEYAYGPAQGLPDTKVGTFTQALYDEATKNGWTVISMKNDWKRIFAFEN